MQQKAAASAAAAVAATASSCPAVDVPSPSLPPPPPSPPPPAAPAAAPAPARTPTALLRRRILVRAKPDLPAYLKLCAAGSSDGDTARLLTPPASRSASRDNLAEEEDASTAGNPRRNTLDRLPRFRWGGGGGGGDKAKKSEGGGGGSGSGDSKRKPRRSSDKTESLRALTERLKPHSLSPDRKKAPALPAPREVSPPPPPPPVGGTYIATALVTTRHAPSSPPPAPQSPPAAAAEVVAGVSDKAAANKEAAAAVAAAEVAGWEASAAGAAVGGGADDQASPSKDASSALLRAAPAAPVMDAALDTQSARADCAENDDIFECYNIQLSKPESRTIVGSYMQRTIPIRSASFSQVDFSPADGKYIRSSGRTSPYSAFTTVSNVRGGLPLSANSSIAGGSLTLPRRRLPDISASPSVSPSSSTMVSAEEPTGSTPSVDSAVGSDEGFVAGELPQMPLAKASAGTESSGTAGESAHKAPGARSLTYPLPRRGSRSDEDIPFSSIDGNGLKSLSYAAAAAAAVSGTVRELPEVIEECEPSVAEEDVQEEELVAVSSVNAEDSSVHLAQPRFYLGDDPEQEDPPKSECAEEAVTQADSDVGDAGARETGESAPSQSEQSADEAQCSDAGTAPRLRKGPSSDEEPLLSEQIDSDGWVVSERSPKDSHKARPSASSARVSPERDSSADNDTDHDVFVVRWPARPLSSQAGEERARAEVSDAEGARTEAAAAGPPPAPPEAKEWSEGECEGEAERGERGWSSAQEESQSPDEGGGPRTPLWAPRASPRRTGAPRPRLMCQSSDEKDDEPPALRPSPRRYQLLARADSLSEGESDPGERGCPPTPLRDRDRTASPSFFQPSDLSDSEGRGGTAAGPAAGGGGAGGGSGGGGSDPRSPHVPRRYSKRPLRGPFGQMLEANMKIPETTRIFSKLNYNDDLKFLEEIVTPGAGEASRSANEASPPRAPVAARPASADPRDGGGVCLVRPRALTAQSLDDSQLRGGYGRASSATSPPSPQPRLSPKRKVSANIPFSPPPEACPATPSAGPFVNHQRTTSSPSQLESYARRAENHSQPHQQQMRRAPPEPTPELLAELLRGSSERLLAPAPPPSPAPSPAPAPAPASPPAPAAVAAAPAPPPTPTPAPAPPPLTPLGPAPTSPAPAPAPTPAPAGGGSSATPNGAALQHWKDTRSHVVAELFETERSYVESLQILVTKYLKPLKSPENAGLVDAALVDEIFYQVPAILSHHEVFLEQLRKRLDTWDVRQTVGDVFLDAFTKQTVIETYTSFINNWKTAKEVVKNACQAKPAFAKFLEAMAREHKGKLALDCLLIMPVQRIPRYELLIQTLLKHTDTSHPDYQLLLEAQREVHDLALKINCTERETLKELEALIEGLINLVTPERCFLRHDLVTMASGQGTRKERALFLFSDLLVITSIKRRTGTIRKPSTSCPGSIASTLEANKYKLLMRIPLDDLEIVKAKDENVRRILREIEHLVEDVATLNQMSELVSTLHCPHSTLEELVRDTLSTLNKQLTERQNCDSQLSYLELSLNTQSGMDNISVVFTKPDKKTSWEEAFNEAKQKLALSADRRPVPEFLSPLPIRKTRAGLQFTCAAPTLGLNAYNMRDVWVCNSDGYVGQVCVLSLQPEPTVVSCNGVCNARILCIASIPAGMTVEFDIPRLSSGSSCSSGPFTNSKTGISISVEDADEGGGNIQLDSSSSSDDEEDGDDGTSVVPGTEEDAKRIRSASDSMTSDSGLLLEETDCLQPTMWLGTEDGCIHVYNCSDNIRIKKNKVKIQHGSSVHCIIYLDNRVFVSLANGDITVYVRHYLGGWNTSDPYAVSVGTAAMPVTRMLPISGKLWCACHNFIKILNTNTLEVEHSFPVNTENSRAITNMAASGFGVWISMQNSAIIRLFHAVTRECLCDVNVAPAVTKMLASCDDIIRQHKAACLRVTSLLACKDLLWIGTSAGVILTMPLPHVSASTTKLNNVPTPTGVPHGHTGHVRFLTYVETAPSSNSDSLVVRQSMHHRFSLKNKPDLLAHQSTSTSGAKLLVISGGDGYEDFRMSSVSEVVGREDATNHLLLWHV